MKVFEKIKNMGGWLTENEANLLYKLAKNTKNQGVIVEVGSWKGRSTICLAEGSKQASGQKIIAIDPHIGSSEHQKAEPGVNTFEEFKANIKEAGVDDIVEPIVKFSYEAVKDFDKEIELIFIDGAHEYEHVKRDFDDWYPKVKNGGVMAFHDSTNWPGPIKVVDDHIFKGVGFKNVGFADSISFGTKVEKNTILDRVRNKMMFIWKKIYEYLRKYRKTKALKPLKEVFKKVFKMLNK